MSEEFNWDKAVDEWQQHQPDLPAIKKNMRWLSLRMKLVLALDVVSLLILLPFNYFIFLSGEAISVKIWFVLLSMLAAVGVYFDFYLRKELWELPETTRDVFAHLVKRAQAGIRIARFAAAYLSIFLFLLFTWSGYIAMYEPFRFEKAGAVVGLLVGSSIIAVSIVVSIWYGKRKKQELIEAEKNYRNFIDSNE